MSGAPGDLGQLAKLRKQVETQHRNRFWFQRRQLVVVDHLEAVQTDGVLLLRVDLKWDNVCIVIILIRNAYKKYAKLYNATFGQAR